MMTHPVYTSTRFNRLCTRRRRRRVYNIFIFILSAHAHRLLYNIIRYIIITYMVYRHRRRPLSLALPVTLFTSCFYLFFIFFTLASCSGRPTAAETSFRL